MYKIDKRSLIFPKLIPLQIPGFEKHNVEVVPKVLSFKEKRSEDWFYEFVDTVEGKLGKDFFPIMRLSDGEYKFILGNKPPHYGGELIPFFKDYLKYILSIINSNKNFKAATLPGVSSGNYSRSEVDELMSDYKSWIKGISENGVLALHLTYSKKPFQQKWHLSLSKWFIQNDITLHDKNYYPFYFVYALLRGDQRSRVFRDRNILVIHSSEGEKKNKIISSLKSEGVNKIYWVHISSSKSLFDKINLDDYLGKVDLAIVGAGVGKPNILMQLEPLKVPCIDAGFVFEVWADDENKWKRPFMLVDQQWELSKVKFL